MHRRRWRHQIAGDLRAGKDLHVVHLDDDLRGGREDVEVREQRLAAEHVGPDGVRPDRRLYQHLAGGAGAHAEVVLHVRDLLLEPTAL